MKFKIMQAGNGRWRITPESGKFAGVEIAEADGVAMNHVQFVKLAIYGEVSAVWGLTMLDEAAYDDSITIRALHFGCNFNMRGQHNTAACNGAYACVILEAPIVRAETLWVLGDKLTVFGGHYAR